MFVSLGIKGNDKTVAALQETEKGLKDVASLSLEAKAAIVGAAYALERLFQSSGHKGTELNNFNTLLGQGTQTLQQYQYALRQVGVSNEETEATFKNLSSTATKARFNLGARPTGLAQVAKYTGGAITNQDLARYEAHPEEFLKRIQEYAKKEKDIGLRNEVLRSFGLSDASIAGTIKADFSKRGLNKAPVYSENEIASLNKANIAWINLGNHIEMAIGHLNAAHGGELVRDFTLITDSLIKLSAAFLKIGESTHAFKGISIVVSELAREINDVARGEAP